MGLTVYGGGGKPEEEKTVTAGTSVIEVSPSSGKVMKKVTVNPTPTESKSVTPTTSELTVTPSEGKHLAEVIIAAVEDVTPEVTAQTPVITQILEGLVGKAQGANITPETVLKGFKGYRGQELVDGNYVPHGAYGWKKYTLTYSETSRANAGEETIPDIGSLHTAIKVYMSKSYTFDKTTGTFTLVNPTTTTVAYGHSYVFDGEYYFMVNGSTGDKMFKSAGISSSSHQTKILNLNDRVYLKASSTSYAFYVYSNTANKVDFVDFVVSDSPTTYPDGGEQGGYYYKKLRGDEMTIYTGEITTASSPRSITIPNPVVDASKIEKITVFSKTTDTGILFLVASVKADRVIETSVSNTSTSSIEMNARTIKAATKVITVTSDSIKITTDDIVYAGTYSWEVIVSE